MSESCLFAVLWVCSLSVSEPLCVTPLRIHNTAEQRDQVTLRCTLQLHGLRCNNLINQRGHWSAQGAGVWRRSLALRGVRASFIPHAFVLCVYDTYRSIVDHV